MYLHALLEIKLSHKQFAMFPNYNYFDALARTQFKLKTHDIRQMSDLCIIHKKVYTCIVGAVAFSVFQKVQYC